MDLLPDGYTIIFATTVTFHYYTQDYPGGNKELYFTYNDWGALTSDESRGITDIIYDNFGNPTQINFSNTRKIINVYSATGEKLRTTVTFGQILHLDGVSTLEMDAAPMGVDAVDATSSIGTIPQNVTEYHGPVIYRNGKLDMVLFPGGYATQSGSDVTFHYYTQDYLGNNRAVINGSTGAIEQTIAYYPYGGVIADLGTPTTGQPYKFGGKELITANGLNEYDFGARRYYQAIPHFTSIDPLCEDTKHLSPYLYCGNNPVNAFDPDGRSTWVTDIGNGMYQVIGGDLNDNDLNIYEYKKDKNGNYTVRGKAIGQTTSMTSFFDSDYEDGEGRWMDKSVIDTTDGSGEQFMYNLVSDSPRLLEYMNKARNGHEYDFKVTNGNPQENPTLDPYRGMPFGFTEAGNPIYTSARDIGNIAAGYVAARYKLPWWFSRAGFDSYQVMKSLKFKKEGKSTINAERYGYDCVKNGLPIFNKPVRSFRIFE